MNDIYETLKKAPIIASVLDEQSLSLALESKCKVIFVLYGTILNITDIAKRIREHNKIGIINVDLIDGFANKEIVIQYIKENTHFDGIVSSKVNIIREANKLGIITIFRAFLIDSFAYKSLKKQLSKVNLTFLQVMPGWPRLITWCAKNYDYKIISGGLLCNKEDMQAAIASGAYAVSTSNNTLWDEEIL